MERIIFLSEKAYPELIERFGRYGQVVILGANAKTYSAIATHPDIQLLVIEDQLFIDQQTWSNLPPKIADKMLSNPQKIHIIDTDLGSCYPKSVLFNAKYMDRLFVHHLAYTQTQIRAYVQQEAITAIDVKQGYTGCSLLLLNRQRAITGDQGVARKLRDQGLEVLLIDNRQILLPGFEHGFIGGCCGLIGKKVFFNGDLDKHSQGRQIRAFIYQTGYQIEEVKGQFLQDIGSIIAYPLPKQARTMNIPIFIPHQGCPNDCVFCNQRKISGKQQPEALDYWQQFVEDSVQTVNQRKQVEIAFFGGSFTGLEPDLMRQYLEFGKRYVERYALKGIRMSTRPDYITPEIMKLLSHYPVTAIELGVQSMDDRVLAVSRRNHSADQVRQAARLIQAQGIEWGVQIMLGLPRDDSTTAVATAKQLLALKPQTVRLYPTLVLENTILAQWYQAGRYQPLELNEAVELAAKLLVLFLEQEVTVLRVGLQSSKDLAKGGYIAGPYHPAFKELVQDRIVYDGICRIMESNRSLKPYQITVNDKMYQRIIGHQRANLRRLKAIYPKLTLQVDAQMADYLADFAMIGGNTVFTLRF